MTTEPTKRRTRISPVERAERATDAAVQRAIAALAKYAAIDAEAAQRVILAVRGGVVPGVTMTIEGTAK